jgi:YidC/Oxa1 family membrane protein insertase
MGASMLLQQKMSPPMGDAAQAKMMMFMPIIFTVIFINFSSGLVLYWLVNNVLSMAQQHYITKKNA